MARTYEDIYNEDSENLDQSNLSYDDWEAQSIADEMSWESEEDYSYDEGDYYFDDEN